MPKIAFQRLLPAIVAAVWIFAAPSLQAQNKYDVLARVLQPYGALFYSKATTKAMQADVILREGPPTAAEIRDRPLRVFLQMPDKLRIETLDPQHRVVFCRNGQKVWIYPHEYLADIMVAGRQPDREIRIPDFRLPLKDQQILWIPALFQILRFEPGSDTGGAATWVLDFQVAPEFAQALKCDAWRASALVRQSDFAVRRLRVDSSKWTGAVDVLACRFEKALPSQTWEPDPELAKEATPIPPQFFDSALQKIAAIAIPR
jgi:outer membrane lipoprotein-sorting protein